MNIWDTVKTNSKLVNSTVGSPGNEASATKKEVETAPDTSSELPLPLQERYKVERSVGTGAFGAALLVVSKSTNKKSVAKVMNVLALSAKDKQHTKSEIDCLSQCNHMNIIQYVESYADETHLVLVTEFADGGDLGQEIRVRRKKNLLFTSTEIAVTFVQICLALDYVHQKDILHRDVKPANVFFTRKGLVKMGDFGFSKHYDETISNQVGQTLCGTPYYLAPEMWLGERYSKKADMWASGIILYEMMMQMRPFAGDTMKELADAVRKGDFLPIPAGKFDNDLIKACNMLLTVDASVRPELRTVLKFNVFQTALRSILGLLGHVFFANCREAMTAHITTMLVE